jgi:hypothetical protein
LGAAVSFLSMTYSEGYAAAEVAPQYALSRGQ